MDGDGYEIRMIDEEKGRGVFALREFKEDDVILEEKPIICCQFAWNADYGYLSCDNCMRPLETAEENAQRLTGKADLQLPYPELCEVNKEAIVECEACGTKYCCAECLHEANEKYHKTLCIGSRDNAESHPLVELKEAWKQFCYPPETGTIMFMARMVAYVNQAADKTAALSVFNHFCHQTVNHSGDISHNILEEKFVGQIEMLRQLMEKALNKEFTPHWFTPEGFRSLLAMVGTNGQGVGTSSFATWARKVMELPLPEDLSNNIQNCVDKLYDDMDEVVGPFLSNEGLGMYVLQSTMNHSCSPNAVVTFPYSNSTLAIKALRDIRPDEEICISYFHECDLDKSRHSRQKYLRSMYLFSCRCEKCQSQINDPDVTSDEEEEEENEMSD